MRHAFQTCLVTHRVGLGPSWARDLPRLVGWAAEAGVDLIQVREADLEAKALASLVGACRAAAAGSARRRLVHARRAVAPGEGAAGVPQPERGLLATAVRRVVPPGFLIGRSVHHPSALAQGGAAGCDLVLFGTVLASSSKPGVRPAGLAALADAVVASPVPVLAIGGISDGALPAVAATGAAGVAAISWLMAPDLPELRRRVQRAREAFDTLGRRPR